MNWLARVFIFSNLLMAAGCSQLPQGVDRVALVDHLVKQHEFAQAKKLLAELDTKDPQYGALANRRRALRPLIARFEEKCIERSDALQSNEQWVEALRVLDGGLEKLPESQRLALARQTLMNEKQDYLDGIERQIKLLEGKMLPTQTALLQKRVQAEPHNLIYRWQVYQIRRKSGAIIDDMIACADRAQGQGNFELSADCLSVAENMTGDTYIPRLAKLREKQEQIDLAAREAVASKRAAEKAAAAKKARQEAQVAARAERDLKNQAHRATIKARRKIKREKIEELKQLKQEYRDLVAAGWWLEARAKLEELKVKAPADDVEVATWSSHLQRLIDSSVKMSIEKGQVYYSQGFLLEALRVWREAHALAPDNTELKDHIARVERFLDNLDRLHAVEG